MSFHFEVPLMSMHLIVMDLNGKFKLSSQRNQYALTVIDMLIYYPWCIPLYTKEC